MAKLNLSGNISKSVAPVITVTNEKEHMLISIVVKVPKDGDFPISGSGKSLTIATTGGIRPIVDTPFTIGLNVNAPIPAGATE